MAIVAPRRDEILTERGELTLRATRFFESLTVATNETTDNINEKLPQSSLANQILGKVLELEKRREVLVTTATSLTAKAFQTVECINTSLISITLDPNAIKDDFINVIRTAGPVDLIGPINDRTNLRINVKEFSVKIMFNGTQWRRV